MTVYSMGAQSQGAYAPQVLSLYGMAEEILRKLNAAAAQMQVTLPTRQLIYMAPTPVDCPQVSVMMGGWAPAALWEGFVSCQTFKWAGIFSIVITRKTPAVPKGIGNKVPEPALMREAAMISSADADVLVALVQSFEEIGPEMTLATGAPEGGLQSVELNVQLTAYGSF